MYKKILHTLFHWTSDLASQHILDIYEKKGFCVLDYLYFANINSKRLFDHHDVVYKLSSFRDALLEDYRLIDMPVIHKVYQDAILDADVVLPDGIALQMFYYFFAKKRIRNLNGTDFCPYFLSYIKEHYSSKHLNIILYGTYAHLLEKTRDFLLKQWYNVIYAQDGYTNLDRHKLELALKWKHQDINVLLIARATPEYPIQEIWTYANKVKIREYGLIVMNQAWTFDFWVGEQKRAPKPMRRLKLERLWRLLTDPKRNIKKVLSSLAIFKYIFSYLILQKG